MRISDLKDEDIKVGMKIRSSANPGVTGVIVRITCPPEDRYQYAWVQWSNRPDGDVSGGFWENQCECEIIDDKDFAL